MAALWDNAELLDDLLRGEEATCLDARDSWGRSALHAAATNAGSRCLPILLAAGCNADALCGLRGEGRSPLHIAAEHGHEENVRELIQAGASLLLRDHLGLTAMDLAEKGRHDKCMAVSLPRFTSRFRSAEIVIGFIFFSDSSRGSNETGRGKDGSLGVAARGLRHRGH